MQKISVKYAKTRLKLSFNIDIFPPSYISKHFELIQKQLHIENCQKDGKQKCICVTGQGPGQDFRTVGADF